PRRGFVRARVLDRPGPGWHRIAIRCHHVAGHGVAPRRRQPPARRRCSRGPSLRRGVPVRAERSGAVDASPPRHGNPAHRVLAAGRPGRRDGERRLPGAVRPHHHDPERHRCRPPVRRGEHPAGCCRGAHHRRAESRGRRRGTERTPGGGLMPGEADILENQLTPLHVFRFHVTFKRDNLPGGSAAASPVDLCSGAFAECTGLEATMEPKVIKAGGANDGAAQRVGPVTFATVVLKRGMTRTRDLWHWFQTVGGGGYSYRLSVEIAMQDPSGNTVLTWALARALP